MSQRLAWSRAAMAGAALLISLNACDSVLGIEEPQDRPNDGGEAGEPTAAAGKNTGGSQSTTPQGGEGGEPSPIATGGAGEGGGAGDGGSAGQPPEPECAKGEARCTNKAPEVCDETGHWVHNTAEAEGDCPILCGAGKCIECEGDVKQCSDCYGADGAGGAGSDDSNCNPRQLQKCVDGRWEDDTLCTNYCDAGKCQTPTSCTVSGDSRAKCNGGSCCESLLVPGGTFQRDFDFSPTSEFQAEVSPFFLDRYEVTVGRMKQFVAAYSNINLNSGDGKAPHIAADTGWNEKYDLPQDATALTDMLKCDFTSWSDSEDNSGLAANCVSFEVAYAFCIWDGGRLPTEVEWNFAVSGGIEQRTYPWGESQASSELAYCGLLDDALPTLVGSKPPGTARWGHADLSGNVSEWTLDYFYEEYPPGPCIDCMAAAPAAYHTIRGAPYTSIVDYQVGAYRGFASEPSNAVGFRCARDSVRAQK